MKLPPMWKIRRELWRIREQLSMAISPAYIDRFRQWEYDRNLGSLLRQTPGALPLSARTAVLVLFQHKGLAPSIFLTLDHLAQEGWSVVIVSNCPLSQDDRARVADKSAHVIERPNIGYDFGAYREGWRWRQAQSSAPPLVRFIVMNDSSWFPLRMEDDSLRRMEALDADLTGHIFKTEDLEARGRDHVESHLLMLGPRALAHPAIQRFWADYRLRSHKAQTIAHGEKGISQTALRAGLTVRGLLDRETLLELMSTLPEAERLEALARTVMHRPEERALRAELLARAERGGDWSDEFLRWTDQNLRSSRQFLVSATFVHVALKHGKMGFLKKSNDRRFHLTRLAVLQGLADGTLSGIDSRVVAEIEAAVAAWTPPFDWRAKPGETEEITY